jgi:hypothetical protein
VVDEILSHARQLVGHAEPDKATAWIQGTDWEHQD